MSDYDYALRIAREGGGPVAHHVKKPHVHKFHVGPIHSSVAGRTDHLPITVESGSYVIPADIISAFGEGNTIAGFKHARRVFGGMPRGQGAQPYNHEGGPYGGGSGPYGQNGKIPYGMARGGMPSCYVPSDRSAFADGGAPKDVAVTAEDALRYRQLAGKHNTNTLAAAFDRAIAHHLSLNEVDRKRNSKAATERVGRFTKTASGVPPLLSKNAKMMKSEKGVEGKAPIQLPDGRGVETTGLALSPAYQEDGFATCSNFKSCEKACLGLTSGGNWMFGGGKDLNAIKGPRLAHFKNTMAMLGDPEAFAVKLHDEIGKAKTSAEKNNNKLGLRLNVLSDIHPRVHQSIIKSYPDVDFYDYTKSAASPIADNHHYTYSSTGVSQPDGINGPMMTPDTKDKDGKVIEKGKRTGVVNPHQNWTRMRKRLDMGHNVAMPFSKKGKAGDENLPLWVHDHETDRRYRVIDGDTHDYRPMDKVAQPADPKAPRNPGVIVGLRNKAQNTAQHSAAASSQGFFTHYDPKNNPERVVKIAPQDVAKPALTNEMQPESVQ